MRLRRGEWLFLGMALVIAVLFGLSRPVARLFTASDGTLIDNRPTPPEGQIVYVIPGARTDLRTGDVVLAINGRALSDWARASKWMAGSASEFGAPLTYLIQRDGRQIETPIILRSFFRRRLTLDWPNTLLAFVYLGVGVYVFLRRSRLPAARALLVIGVTMFCIDLFRAFDLEPTDFLFPVLFGWTSLMLTLVAPHIYTGMLHFSMVFPEPFPWVQRNRWLIPAMYLVWAVVFGVLNYVWMPGSYDNTLIAYQEGWRISYQVGALVMLCALVLSVLNGRRAQRELERQQWLIVFAGAAVSVGGTLLTARLPELFGSPLNAPVGWYPLLESAFPLALAIAVLRYRLFDIGTLINRALVYGVLTVCVIGIYAVLVIGLGTVFEVQDNLWLSLIATGVIAVLFQPLRERLQAMVNRRMFGLRDDPYDVLTRLGERMGAAQEARSALHAAVESVTRALNVPYAVITMPASSEQPGDRTDARFESPVAESGARPPDAPAGFERLPLLYRGEAIGALSVAPRSPGEAFSTADERMLRDVLPQITLAAHNARLTLDLLQSRQRVITALEDERRRLRRDLHDGLGPTLATVMLNLDTARGWVARGVEPKEIDTLLAGTRALSDAALSDVRRVAYDLRPPALDDLGLSAALSQHAERISLATGMAIEVDSAIDGRSLPAAVEVAAYRIAIEALTNAVRHARAQHSEVSLRIARDTRGEMLVVTVCDDGLGLPAQVQFGVGIRSMRERADELAGTLTFEASRPHGVRVVATLPLNDGV